MFTDCTTFTFLTSSADVAVFADGSTFAFFANRTQPAARAVSGATTIAAPTALSTMIADSSTTAFFACATLTAVGALVELSTLLTGNTAPLAMAESVYFVFISRSATFT